MSEWLPFLVFGVTTGAIYGLSAMGLVLTYKTSGVFNIAHGTVCASAAFTFYTLRQVHDVPWPIAAALVVFVYGAVAGLLLERMAMLLADVSVTYKIVGTVGLFVAIQAGITLIYGDIAKNFEPFLSQDKAFGLPGVDVTYDNLITVVGCVLAAAGLAVFFRVARLGIAMRAVVDDPQLIDITGYSPVRVRRTAWVIGSSFAAASGVLLASNQAQVDVNVLALLVVQAFGAATIARFQSLPMCLVGGVIVGVLQKLISKEIGSQPSLQGLDAATPVLILFIGLLVIPRSRLVEVGRQVRARGFSSRAGKAYSWWYVPLIGVALLIPQLDEAHLFAWNLALAQVTLFASLHLLVRTSGQISLCHIGFSALGAATVAHMLGRGVPFPLAVLIAGAVCVPPALVIAVPAIRLSSLYLALATFGFGIALAAFAYGKSWMFASQNRPVDRPQMWGLQSDSRYFYLLLGVAVLALFVVTVVERSRLGRLLRGLSDSPVALSTLGLDVNICRVLVFCISGALAGVSGAMYASVFGGASPDSFNYAQSLVVLAVLAISGSRLVPAVLVAPVLLYVVPNYIDNPDHYKLLQIGFGLAAIYAAAASTGRLGSYFAARGVAAKDRLHGPAAVRVDRLRSAHLVRTQP
ncbi:ABC transporter permease [Sporichthya sp.]|uniref:branched-chain amino acid ABC transporter permease n=1 Tax=Sporichthya sp. TaxID=65475 RepID=UPI0025E0EE8A|nr:ABC transporter permease [Sporichthya sp.]